VNTYDVDFSTNKKQNAHAKATEIKSQLFGAGAV
jgi:hypothetical protein